MLSIYVDGTYNKQEQRAGYGFLVLDEDEDILYVQKGEITQYLESWQISAELIGALRVMEWCSTQQITEFKLYFDYEGVEKLASGELNAKAPITKYYVRAYAAYRKLGIKPIFHQIPRKYNLAHKIASEYIFNELSVSMRA